MGMVSTFTLLPNATATGAGPAIPAPQGRKQYQVGGATTAGAGSAVVAIQGSNNGTDWDTLGTVTLTLATTVSSDGFGSDDTYVFLRANVTTLTGTGANVHASVGN